MCVSVKDAFSVSPSVCHLSSFILSLFFLAHQQSLFPVTYLTRSRVSALQLTVTGMDPIMTEARRNAALWVGLYTVGVSKR